MTSLPTCTEQSYEQCLFYGWGDISGCSARAAVDVGGLLVCPQHAVVLRLERIAELLARIAENSECLPEIAHDLGHLQETVESIDDTADSIDWRVMPWWARCWNRVRYRWPTRKARSVERESKVGGDSP